MSDKDSNNL